MKKQKTNKQTNHPDPSEMHIPIWYKSTKSQSNFRIDLAP